MENQEPKIEDHAPAPWFAVEHPFRMEGRQPKFTEGVFQILPADDVERMPIATIDYGDDEDPATRASARPIARLIAAAPDLLEALRGVLRVADRNTVEFDAARAAIAKATT